MKNMATLALMALAASVVAGPASAAGSDWAALPEWKFENGRKATSVIEQEIRDASLEQYPSIEAKLLGVLAAPKATDDSRAFVCRMLRQVGSARCVSAVAPLLADEKLSYFARLTLEGMPDLTAGAALREAIGKAHGSVKVGLIGSVGARRDRQAVGQLAPLVNDGDAAVAAAAIGALGKIADPEAARVLAGAKATEPLEACLADARLCCADGMLAAGQADKAAAIYRQILDTQKRPAVRQAALRGVVTAEGGKSVPLLMEVLKGNDVALKQVAGELGALASGQEATKQLSDGLAALPPQEQAVVIRTLAVRGDKVALAGIVPLVKSSDPAVSKAAIEAVGILGGVEHVPLLLEAGAVDALVTIADPRVDETLMKQAGSAGAGQARVIVAVLARRHCTVALPTFMEMAKSADPATSRDALKAVGVMGQADQLQPLAQIIKSGSPPVASGALRAYVAVALRESDADGRAQPLLAIYPDVGVETRAMILGCLSGLGGPKALETARASGADKDERIQDAAVRALSNWPTAEAAADVLEIARHGAKPAHQILALRGYIRMASLAGSDKAIEMVATAGPLAQRPEEKKQILAALGNIASVESFKMASGYLKDDRVKEEAAAACVSIAGRIYPKNPQDVRPVLEDIVRMNLSGQTTANARKILGM